MTMQLFNMTRCNRTFRHRKRRGWASCRLRPQPLALLLPLLIHAGCQPAAQPSASKQWEAIRPDSVQSSKETELEKPEAPKTAIPNSSVPDEMPTDSIATDSWGRVFFTDRDRFQRAPKIKQLQLPVADGDEAIWGATGRDSKGNIYFGLASKASSEVSAGLVQFSPRTGDAKLLGRVDEWLNTNSSGGKAAIQDKIHSKLYEATDGNLYFASQDESGEKPDGTANGKGGGHLMRVNRSTGKVESVLQTKASLISIGCSGRYIYALGYFGSVIYQFDTQTQSNRSVVIPNYGGHVSRNILVTPTGHVLAMRVTGTTLDDSRRGTNWTPPVAQDEATDQFQTSEEGTLRRRVLVELVELDPNLIELHAWPMEGYEAHGDTSSHGITSFASLMDGSLLFTTQNGLLWCVHALDGKPDRLESLGWIHPEGESSSTAMFAPTGNDYLIAVTKIGRRFDLLVYYLKLRESVLLTLDLDSEKLFNQPLHLLYGSETLDDFGNAYIAGWKRMPTGYEPIALQLQWP
jgi:hypothetical protein